MKCHKCNKDLGDMCGLVQQLEHYMRCPNNRPEPLTRKSLKKTIEKMYDRPRIYSGNTPCGMHLTSTEMAFFNTCDREGCERCREFDQMFIDAYNNIK